MDHGPVLSQTYNLIVAEQSPDQPTSYWRQFISEPEQYEVRLLADTPPVGELSPAQLGVLDVVFREFGAMSR